MTLEDIIQCINLHSNQDIRDKCKSTLLGNLRSIYYKIAKDNLFLHDEQIGHEVGKHKTTLENAIKKLETLLLEPLWRDFYYDCVRYLDCKSDEKYQEGYVQPVIYTESQDTIYKNIPEYILKHLEQYTEQELTEVFKTRLEPFKRLLDTRTRQKQIKQITGATLKR